MNKILCYGNKRLSPAIWPDMLSLANAFGAQGYQCLMVDTGSESSIKEGLRVLGSDGDIAFSVGRNNLGTEYYLDGKPLYPYQDSKVPHVSITHDVPYNKYVSGFAEPVKESIVTYLDRDVDELLPVMYPNGGEHSLFMPLGGTPVLPREQVFGTKRNYDVVFSSSVWNNGVIAPGWKEMTGNRHILGILDDVLDLLKSSAISTHRAFKVILKDRGMLSADYMARFLPFFWPMLEYIKVYRKVECLRILAGLGVTVEVIGAGWDRMPFADKLHLHGAMPYEKTLEMFSKAKVVYQDNADFGNGAHDRVFSAMLNGAVVVSEYSQYLSEEFVDGEEIFLFDWKEPERQISVIRDLLADECMRMSAALKAFRKADKRHRWSNRARTILEAVSIFYGDRL